MFTCAGSWRTKPALKVVNASTAHSATSPSRARRGSSSPARHATANPIPASTQRGRAPSRVSGSWKPIASE